MAESKQTGVEVAQGLLALIGITAGAIPLVRVTVFDGDVGRWLAWLPATDGPPGEWVVPLVVLVVAGALVLGLEKARP